jgi:hypothetical protein
MVLAMHLTSISHAPISRGTIDEATVGCGSSITDKIMLLSNLTIGTCQNTKEGERALERTDYALA